MPEHRENTLQDLGKEVRRKREELGLSLKDVHEGTKIRMQFLEGIERGDFSEFPGTVYVRGFIRNYLQFIGAEEFWADYLPVLSEGTEKVREEEPAVVGSCTPPAKGFKPASRFWIFAILLLVAVGSSWYLWYTWDRNGAPSFAVRGENSEENGGTVDETAPGNAVAETASRTAAGESSNEADPNSRETLSADLSAVPLAGMTPPPSAAELVGANASQTPTAVPEKKKDKELVIDANGDCWVRVRQGTKTLYERTLKAGESVSFTVKERIEVTYGRAGSVRTRWNGEDLGNPGTTRGVERIFYAPDGTTGRIAR
ncbi:MAG: cytoskeleton protein RodZ [Synergistaceae bacterium]|nr:cytoskeleton protein RodZ [Synergistaceae bacterium]